MSVTFVTKHPRNGWEFEEHKMGDNFKHDAAEEVVQVDASGDEQVHIVTMCNNLPFCNGLKEVTWFGDHARFIAANVRF